MAMKGEGILRSVAVEEEAVTIKISMTRVQIGKVVSVVAAAVVDIMQANTIVHGIIATMKEWKKMIRMCSIRVVEEGGEEEALVVKIGRLIKFDLSISDINLLFRIKITLKMKMKKMRTLQKKMSCRRKSMKKEVFQIISF